MTDVRRHGLLGRAPSLASNPSGSFPLSRAGSMDDRQQQQGEGSAAGTAGEDDEDGVGAASSKAIAAATTNNNDNPTTANSIDSFLPSQTLTYEDPEMQKKREMMIRKMGGTVEDTGDVGVRVQRIGFVRDGLGGGADDDEGVGGRVRRRGRHLTGVGVGE